MKILVVLIVSCVLSSVIAQTLGLESRRPNAGTYMLEGLGGAVGLEAGAACGVAVTYGVTALYIAANPNAGWGALGVAAITVLVCGAALPACAGYSVSAVGDNLTGGGGSPLRARARDRRCSPEAKTWTAGCHARPGRAWQPRRRVRSQVPVG